MTQQIESRNTDGMQILCDDKYCDVPVTGGNQTACNGDYAPAIRQFLLLVALTEKKLSGGYIRDERLPTLPAGTVDEWKVAAAKREP